MIKFDFFISSCLFALFGFAQYSETGAFYLPDSLTTVFSHPLKELPTYQKPKVILKLPEVRYKVYNMAQFLVFSDELCPPLDWGNRSLQRFQYEQLEFTVVREKRRK